MSEQEQPGEEEESAFAAAGRLGPPLGTPVVDVFAIERGGWRYGFVLPSEAGWGGDAGGRWGWVALRWRTKRRLRWAAWRSRRVSRRDAARRQSVRSGRKRR